MVEPNALFKHYCESGLTSELINLLTKEICSLNHSYIGIIGIDHKVVVTGNRPSEDCIKEITTSLQTTTSEDRSTS